jgi:hypothetical protein
MMTVENNSKDKSMEEMKMNGIEIKKVFITIIFSAVKRMYWHSCKQWLQNSIENTFLELQLRILTD